MAFDPTTIIVAAGVSVVAPTIVATMASRTARASKREDWKRQDEVEAKVAAAADLLAQRTEESAARQELAAKTLAERTDEAAVQAAQAAKLLLDAQAKTIERTDEVARVAAEAQAANTAKLDDLAVQSSSIHVLVNQKLTDVTTRALKSSEGLLKVLEEMRDQQAASGVAPSPVEMQRIEATKADISQLKVNLAERESQQAVVDAKASKVTEKP
jgi:hypothetical protein